MDRHLAKAIAADADGTLKATLLPSVAATRNAVETALPAFSAATTETVSAVPTNAGTLVDRIVPILQDTQAKVATVFIKEVQDRIDASRNLMLIRVGSAGALVLLGLFVLVFAVELQAVRPLKKITASIWRLSAGEIDTNDGTLDGPGEIGLLAEALTTLKRTVNEAFAQGEMIRSMPVNVMVADPKTGIITYANEASKALIGRLEAYLPINAADLVGTNIDRFHRVPGHQRSIIGDPKRLPWTTKIQIGPEWADLVVSAINDKEGRYMGAMLIWIIATHRVKLASDFEGAIQQTVDGLSGTADGVQKTATALAGTAEQTRLRAQAVAAAAEQATNNVQTVAAASEELTASIAEISRQVVEASDIAKHAVEEATSTNATVDGLSASATRIGDVVQLISEIASQTNLLALNATIEAVRAGESGRGFVVVAAEVKNLANQTAKATDDITQQIQRIQSATADSVGAIRRIGGTIERISAITTTIASAVEEQSAATREISRNVQEASAGTQEVSSNIGNLTQAATDTGQAAQTLRAAAEGLVAQGAMMRTRMNNFIVSMRVIQ
jgi:methyl-accepting chemotaxis protein